MVNLKKNNYVLLLKTISLRQTNKSLEIDNPLECLEISPTNKTGFNVRLRTRQKNAICPLKEFVEYSVL
jgi:hypothetical protein